jgi:hypothetical protein
MKLVSYYYLPSIHARYGWSVDHKSEERTRIRTSTLSGRAHLSRRAELGVLRKIDFLPSARARKRYARTIGGKLARLVHEVARARASSHV